MPYFAYFTIDLLFGDNLLSARSSNLRDESSAMAADQEVVKSLPARDRRLRFGAFEADLDSHELLKSGRLVKLQRKPFQILELLLRVLPLRLAR